MREPCAQWLPRDLAAPVSVLVPAVLDRSTVLALPTWVEGMGRVEESYTAQVKQRIDSVQDNVTSLCPLIHSSGMPCAGVRRDTLRSGSGSWTPHSAPPSVPRPPHDSFAVAVGVANHSHAQSKAPPRSR